MTRPSGVTATSPACNACNRTSASSSPDATSAWTAATFAAASSAPSLATVCASSAAIPAAEASMPVNATTKTNAFTRYVPGGAKKGPADELRDPQAGPEVRHFPREAWSALMRHRRRAGLDYRLCLLSLPVMNGLHGCARIGPLVFHTTLN